MIFIVDLVIVTEEVLSSNNAIWLSKSGQRMAYASFDDRQVDTMEYSIYGVPGSTQFQYPITNQIRYPKVTWQESSSPEFSRNLLRFCHSVAPSLVYPFSDTVMRAGIVICWISENRSRVYRESPPTHRIPVVESNAVPPPPSCSLFYREFHLGCPKNPPENPSKRKSPFKKPQRVA